MKKTTIKDFFEKFYIKKYYEFFLGFCPQPIFRVFLGGKNRSKIMVKIGQKIEAKNRSNFDIERGDCMGVGGRPRKYSPEKFYKEFRKRYPNLSKSVVRWEPHKSIPDRIVLYLYDGEIFIYSYIQQTVWKIERRWK